MSSASSTCRPASRSLVSRCGIHTSPHSNFAQAVSRHAVGRISSYSHDAPIHCTVLPSPTPPFVLLLLGSRLRVPGPGVGDPHRGARLARASASLRDTSAAQPRLARRTSRRRHALGIFARGRDGSGVQAAARSPSGSLLATVSYIYPHCPWRGGGASGTRQGRRERKDAPRLHDSTLSRPILWLHRRWTTSRWSTCTVSHAPSPKSRARRTGTRQAATPRPPSRACGPRGRRAHTRHCSLRADRICASCSGAWSDGVTTG